MNKEDLVKQVAEQTNLSQAAVHPVVTATMENIASALERKNPVMLIGFGTFAVAKRKARRVNHPQTGKPMRIDAKHVPVFRPGSELKRRVAGKRKRGRPRRR